MKTEKKKPLDTLHHIAICVDDIKKSVEWYTKTFSCLVEYQDDTWAILEFGNVKLAMVVAEQHPNHFAIIRPDAESFGPLKEHRDKTRTVYIKDPSGNTVEIMDESSLPMYG